MQFYFVRHGETDSNAKGTLSGSMDSPMNVRGHEQARAMAERMAGIADPPTRLLVSSMRRARETAEYLRVKLKLEPQIVDDIREWDLGEWQAKPYADVKHLILGAGEPKEGETRKKFYARVERAWKENHAESPYVLVSHGVVLLALQDILKVERFSSSNCAIVEFLNHGWRWGARVL